MTTASALQRASTGARPTAADARQPGAARGRALPPAVPAAVPARPARVAPPAAAGTPHGIDPEVWGALTAEERMFFGRVPAVGQPTYAGRAGAAAASAPGAVRRGLHLDVRA